jgi:hypothetical protein
VPIQDLRHDVIFPRVVLQHVVLAEVGAVHTRTAKLLLRGATGAAAA